LYVFFIKGTYKRYYIVLLELKVHKNKKLQIIILLYQATYYYFPKQYKHIIKFLQNCETCNKAAPSVLHAPLHLLVSKHPMQIIEVDFFSSLDPDPITEHRSAS